MQDRQGQPQPPPVPQNEARPDFRAFFIMKPPEFLSGLDPIAAHDERMF